MSYTPDLDAFAPKQVRAAGYSTKKVKKTVTVKSEEFKEILTAASVAVFNASDIQMTPTGKLTTDAKITAMSNEVNMFLEKFIDTAASRYRLTQVQASALHGDAVLQFIAFDDISKVATYYLVELKTGEGFLYNYFHCTRNRSQSFLETIKRFLSL